MSPHTLRLPLLTPIDPEQPLPDPSRFGKLELLGPEGDTVHVWDRADPLETQAAHDVFDGLLARGYSAFTEHDSVVEGPIRAFDPEASYVFVPALQGG